MKLTIALIALAGVGLYFGAGDLQSTWEGSIAPLIQPDEPDAPAPAAPVDEEKQGGWVDNKIDGAMDRGLERWTGLTPEAFKAWLWSLVPKHSRPAGAPDVPCADDAADAYIAAWERYEKHAETCPQCPRPIEIELADLCPEGFRLLQTALKLHPSKPFLIKQPAPPTPKSDPDIAAVLNPPKGDAVDDFAAAWERYEKHAVSCLQCRKAVNEGSAGLCAEGFRLLQAALKLHPSAQAAPPKPTFPNATKDDGQPAPVADDPPRPERAGKVIDTGGKCIVCDGTGKQHVRDIITDRITEFTCSFCKGTGRGPRFIDNPFAESPRPVIHPEGGIPFVPPYIVPKAEPDKGPLLHEIKRQDIDGVTFRMMSDYSRSYWDGCQWVEHPGLVPHESWNEKWRDENGTIRNRWHDEPRPPQTYAPLSTYEDSPCANGRCEQGGMRRGFFGRRR